MPDKIDRLFERTKELEEQVSKLKKAQTSGKVDDLIRNIQNVGEASVVAAILDGVNAVDLRSMGDVLSDRLGSGVVLLGSTISSDKVIFLCMVTADLVKKGVHAGNVVREVAKVTGGNGGGRADMAQAGGKVSGKAVEAVERGKIVIRDALAKG